MVYKLCYIDPDKPKAYFTTNWEKQWGDDWDDRPYESNAGTPYDYYIENNKKVPISIKEIFFELPYDVYYETPRDTMYSVEDINNHRVPWIVYNGNYIFAGISYTNFVKQIEELGGRIYTPKRRSI